MDDIKFKVDPLFLSLPFIANKVNEKHSIGNLDSCKTTVLVCS